MSNLIFYFGSIVIISLFIFIVFIRFKDDKIDLKKHLWLIAIYIFLLILAIIVWRVIQLLLTSNINSIQNYNSILESYSNG